MPEKENAPTQYDAVLADLYAKRDEIDSAINTSCFFKVQDRQRHLPRTRMVQFELLVLE
jgi:hypothetical protein